MTSNELRQVIGMKPVEDPQADQLINNNLTQPKENLEEAEANAIDLDIGSKKLSELEENNG
jgi:hypothetical protein